MAEKKASVVTSVGNASRDFRLVPEGITFGFVEEAIKTSSASLENKEICKGYKYFSEKYITDIRVHHLDMGCIIRAKCYRSQRRNEAPHDVEVVIGTGPSFIASDSKCSCAIGSGGCCGHISGLLYSIAHMKTTGMTVIPNDVAKTSLPQTWHIPRGEKIGGTSSDDVKVQGYGTDFPQRQTRGLRSTLYNPIPSGVMNLDVKKLCEDVSKVDKTCLLLSNISFSNHITNVDTKFGKFPRGSPLATQQKLHHDYVLSILDAGDFPDIPVKSLVLLLKDLDLLRRW
uniref:Uncharacterized protein LOC111103754 n=1 Tax=Crassostrea virginica TaxID=6565 RepID=A0A8B8ARU4_CRAVI|nr:uncharacterized protein LOC111103754 [Crassostrea virginica]